MTRHDDTQLLDRFNRQLAAIEAEVPAPPRWRGSATTQDPRWRFHSLFGLTKTVVAGAVVALFGGFLAVGLLTTQPSEDRLPAVGASASSTVTTEPTALTTSEPGPTTVVAADTSATELDLLPGVELVVEAVEPGVFRVLSDGARDLSRVADRTDLPMRGLFHGNIAAGRDGSVWWFGPDAFFRLGDAETHAWSESELVDGVETEDVLEVASDGTLMRLSDPEHGAVFDGRSWTEREVVPEEPAIWLRGGLRVRQGERWNTLITGFASHAIELAAVGADGTIWMRPLIGDDFTVLSRYGLNDSETPVREWRDFSRGLPLIGGNLGARRQFEVAPDGSVWFTPAGDFERTGTDCDGTVSFDGETVRYFLRDTCIYAMDIAPDGHIWLQAGEPGEYPRPRRSETTVHTYVITPEAVPGSE